MTSNLEKVTGMNGPTNITNDLFKQIVSDIIDEVRVKKKQSLLDNKFKKLLEEKQPRFMNDSFSNYKVTKNNKAVYDKCVDIAKNYKKGDKGIILLGPHGIGKTHLCVSMAKVMIERGLSVEFTSVIDIKTEIMASFNDDNKTQDDIVGAVLSNEVIVLDDLGQDKSSEFLDELLHVIIDQAWKKQRCLIITTNMNGADLSDRYRPAIMSRLMGSCTGVKFTEQDRRLSK